MNRCVSRICFQVNQAFSLICTNFHKCSGFQLWTFQPEKLPTSVAAASAGVAEISCVKKQGPLKALKLTFNPWTLQTVLLPLPFHLFHMAYHLHSVAWRPPSKSWRSKENVEDITFLPIWCFFLRQQSWLPRKNRWCCNALLPVSWAPQSEMEL